MFLEHERKQDIRSDVSKMKIENKYPYGTNHICIEGYRYKQMPGMLKSCIVHPLPQDMDGLLFVGKCDSCIKTTGGK